MFLVPYLLFSPSSGSSFLFNLPFSPLFPLPLSSRFFDLFHPLSLLGLTFILYSSAFCCFPLHTLLYLLHHSPLLFNSPTLPLAPCFSSCLRLRTPTSHMAYWFSRTSHKHTAHAWPTNLQQGGFRMHTCMWKKKKKSKLSGRAENCETMQD